MNANHSFSFLSTIIYNVLTIFYLQKNILCRLLMYLRLGECTALWFNANMLSILLFYVAVSDGPCPEGSD